MTTLAGTGLYQQQLLAQGELAAEARVRAQGPVQQGTPAGPTTAADLTPGRAKEVPQQAAPCSSSGHSQVTLPAIGSSGNHRAMRRAPPQDPPSAMPSKADARLGSCNPGTQTSAEKRLLQRLKSMLSFEQQAEDVVWQHKARLMDALADQPAAVQPDSMLHSLCCRAPNLTSVQLLPSALLHSPLFQATNPAIPNMCAACSSTSTSGCWRRGWPINEAQMAWANLCNRCGLRYKKGLLTLLPDPPVHAAPGCFQPPYQAPTLLPPGSCWLPGGDQRMMAAAAAAPPPSPAGAALSFPSFCVSERPASATTMNTLSSSSFCFPRCSPSLAADGSQAYVARAATPGPIAGLGPRYSSFPVDVPPTSSSPVNTNPLISSSSPESSQQLQHSGSDRVQQQPLQLQAMDVEHQGGSSWEPSECNMMPALMDKGLTRSLQQQQLQQQQQGAWPAQQLDQSHYPLHFQQQQQQQQRCLVPIVRVRKPRRQGTARLHCPPSPMPPAKGALQLSLAASRGQPNQVPGLFLSHQQPSLPLLPSGAGNAQAQPPQTCGALLTTSPCLVATNGGLPPLGLGRLRELAGAEATAHCLSQGPHQLNLGSRDTSPLKAGARQGQGQRSPSPGQGEDTKRPLHGKAQGPALQQGVGGQRLSSCPPAAHLPGPCTSSSSSIRYVRADAAPAPPLPIVASEPATGRYSAAAQGPVALEPCLASWNHAPDQLLSAQVRDRAPEPLLGTRDSALEARLLLQDQLVDWQEHGHLPNDTSNPNPGPGPKLSLRTRALLQRLLLTYCSCRGRQQGGGRPEQQQQQQQQGQRWEGQQQGQRSEGQRMWELQEQLQQHSHGQEAWDVQMDDAAVEPPGPRPAWAYGPLLSLAAAANLSDTPSMSSADKAAAAAMIGRTPAAGHRHSSADLDSPELPSAASCREKLAASSSGTCAPAPVTAEVHMSSKGSGSACTIDWVACSAAGAASTAPCAAGHNHGPGVLSAERHASSHSTGGGPASNGRVRMHSCNSDYS